MKSSDVLRGAGRLAAPLLLALTVACAIALAPVHAEAQYYGIENVAKGKPVLNVTPTALGGPSSVVTDGKVDTYWYSYPVQEYTIDLGAPTSIGKIVVYVSQASNLVISSSLDGITFSPQHSLNVTDVAHSNWVGGMASGPLVFEANGAYSARYLKYRSQDMGCACYQGTLEFAVYEWVSTPPPVLSGVNLATPPSSVMDLYASAPGFPASAVADGNLGTSWIGASSVPYTPVGGQQFYITYGGARIDLGGNTLVHGARLRRPATGGAQTALITLYNAAGTEVGWFGDGNPNVIGTTNPAFGDADFVLNVPVLARYVQIVQMNPTVNTVTARPALAEVEVYGAVSSATYTITASAGPNGSIAPSGAVTVNSGGSQVFSIAPSVGYHIANVLIDGVAVGALPSYTFSGVTANHTIDASFAIDTYTITASAGLNGSIAPSGAVTVNSGDSQTFTITPNAGFHVADVLVDGSSVGAVASYLFSNVTANHTISASFAIDTTPNPYDSLRALLSRDCVTNKGILNSLTVKLNNAEAAEQRGNVTAKADIIGAFVNEVQAQTGKAIDRTCAAELIRLAQLL
ncbi:hypothetical protein [Candidatus Methylomirabilis sp.]|uniref:InlB B-repeat-containing protein n=1 Tax=Candidatus Methylomirabilis sp. TaxID=2032687 RepID=UPI002A5D0CA4|nr:hypothetical protein [Candidatus Methylomirabilis sp.]